MKKSILFLNIFFLVLIKPLFSQTTDPSYINYALSATITCNSSYGTGYSCDSINDGNRETVYLSAENVWPVVITLSWSTAVEFNTTIIWQGAQGDKILDYEIQKSIDGINFVVIVPRGERTFNMLLGSQENLQSHDLGYAAGVTQSGVKLRYVFYGMTDVFCGMPIARKQIQIGEITVRKF